jgi:chromosome segregation ATPase
MAAGARVQDLDVIRLFRAALIKFTESSNSALTDADGEITRKLSWLESEQMMFWTRQIRKWNEEVNRAKDAVRQKRIFKDAMGRQQSTVDEEKHLKKCQAALEECETKLENTRRHAKQLQREHLLYRGGVQRLATLLSSDMPNAIAMLDRVTQQLQQYVAAAPTMATSDTTESTAPLGTDGDVSMKRAVDDSAEESEDKPDRESGEETRSEEPTTPNPGT